MQYHNLQIWKYDESTGLLIKDPKEVNKKDFSSLRPPFS